MQILSYLADSSSANLDRSAGLETTPAGDEDPCMLRAFLLVGSACRGARAGRGPGRVVRTGVPENDGKGETEKPRIGRARHRPGFDLESRPEVWTGVAVCVGPLCSEGKI